MVEFSPEEKKNNVLSEERLSVLVKEFRTKGFLVIKNHFAKEKIQKLNAVINQDYTHYFEDKNHEDAVSHSPKRNTITIDVKGDFNAPEIYCDPLILKILGNLLEPDFVVSEIICVLSLPGSKQMQVHRDGTIFNSSPVRSLLPPFAIGMLIPLVPFNNKNGTTRFWPGSHLGKSTIEDVAQSPYYFEDDIDVGSCILMDYRLCHTGNPNFSDEVRPLLYCNYSNGWYIDVGNYKKQAHFYLNDEEFLKIPEEHRRLFLRRNLDLSPTYKLLENQSSAKHNANAKRE